MKKNYNEQSQRDGRFCQTYFQGFPCYLNIIILEAFRVRLFINKKKLVIIQK